MRPSATQYLASSTARALSGSEVGESAPQRTFNDDRTRNDRAGFYEDNRMDDELYGIHRHSATPLASLSAGMGDYTYPQMLDLPSGQPNQAYSSNIPTYHTPLTSRPHVPRSSSGGDHRQYNNLNMDPQYQPSMQHLYTRGSSSTPADYSSTRCRYDCSVPPGHHCDHEREPR
jgi:hypothetical protein